MAGPEAAVPAGWHLDNNDAQQSVPSSEFFFSLRQEEDALLLHKLAISA